MSNDENIYDDWRRRLDSLGTQSTPDAAQKARVVAARAQVDQAISLATIADSLDALVAHLTGRKVDYAIPEAGQATPTEPEPQGIQSEHDVEVGDLVSPVIKGDGPLRAEVVEVGNDQGEVWLKLAHVSAKFWASQFIVVERSLDAIEQRLDATEPVMTMEDAAAIDGRADDIDDDFGDEDLAGKTDADEQQADALAALRARQGKTKKAGQKR